MLPPLTPVIKNIIFINIAFFITILVMQGVDFNLWRYFPLYSWKSDGFQPFQIITSMFTHFDLMHIFFNMLVLYFFGTMVENRIGSKKTFIAFLFGGIFSTIVFFLTYSLMGKGFHLLGASGAVNTIMVLAALYFSAHKIQLIIPPVSVPIGIVAAIYISIDIISFRINFDGGIAHLAHLGGAAMAFILYYIWEKK